MKQICEKLCFYYDKRNKNAGHRKQIVRPRARSNLFIWEVIVVDEYLASENVYQSPSHIVKRNWNKTLKLFQPH